MISRWNLALAVLVMCTVGTIAVPAVEAVITDADGALAVNVTAALKPGSVVTFQSSLSGLDLTLTCRSAETRFTASTGGPRLGPFAISDPSFEGCTDSLGGHDTITTNRGWTATFVDGPNDESGKATGDMVMLGVPQAGIAITSSKLAGCTIVVAPADATTLSGSYDNRGTLRYTNAPLPYTFTGSTCSLGGASGTWKFGTAPAFGRGGLAGFAVTPPVYDAS